MTTWSYELAGTYNVVDVNDPTIAPNDFLDVIQAVTDWPIAHITDHVQRAARKLISQYRDKPRIKAMLRSLITGQQTLEDAVYEYITVHTIDDAPDHLLQAFGEIVGVQKLREGGFDYRDQVRTKIIVNRQSGEPDSLIRIAATLVGGDFEDILLTEHSDTSATLRLLTDPLPTEEHVRQMNFFLQLAKPGGVKLTLRYSMVAANNTFTFAASNTPQSSTTKGWGNVAQNTGGKWAGAISG